jgi:hypothetical protein
MDWYKLEGCHAGKTGIIIGNGPSLKDVPINFLTKYPSFGTNRIYLLDGFTPTYYVCVNPLVAEQSIDEINALPCQKFVCEKWAYKFDNCLPLVSNYRPHFSLNPQAYIYEGYTVTFACMQIAHWMDFDTILLVGVDHKFTFTGQPNQEMVLEGDDPNHFSPDYFKCTRWNNPDLVRSAQAYHLAKTAYENYGKRIINLTEGSALDVFEKGVIAEW